MIFIWFKRLYFPYEWIDDCGIPYMYDYYRILCMCVWVSTQRVYTYWTEQGKKWRGKNHCKLYWHKIQYAGGVRVRWASSFSLSLYCWANKQRNKKQFLSNGVHVRSKHTPIKSAPYENVIACAYFRTQFETHLNACELGFKFFFIV